MGRYVAQVGRAFPCDEAIDPDPLVQMIETNLGELTGGFAPGLRPALAAARPRLASVPAAAIDGRMLPHEWIAGPGGLTKVDALDHHRDHFFPGFQHPAWDLAAVSVECDHDAAATASMLHAFEENGGDRRARALLPFYQLAYAAFRVGYFTTAGQQQDASRYSQCALNAAACFTASSKSPRKQIARSSMNT
jgi:hypothetical protein